MNLLRGSQTFKKFFLFLLLNSKLRFSMNKALVSKYFMIVLALPFIHSSTRLPGKYDTIVIKHFFLA